MMTEQTFLMRIADPTHCKMLVCQVAQAACHRPSSAAYSFCMLYRTYASDTDHCGCWPLS